MRDLAAFIVAVAALITAVGGLIAVLLRQGTTHDKLTRIEDTLNHTDQQVGSEGKMTLGQRVVAVQRSIDDGLAANAREHTMLADGHHQLGQRVDQVRKDVSALEKRVGDHDDWERDRAAKRDRLA